MALEAVCSTGHRPRGPRGRRCTALLQPAGSAGGALGGARQTRRTEAPENPGPRVSRGRLAVPCCRGVWLYFYLLRPGKLYFLLAILLFLVASMS